MPTSSSWVEASYSLLSATPTNTSLSFAGLEFRVAATVNFARLGLARPRPP